MIKKYRFGSPFETDAVVKEIALQTEWDNNIFEKTEKYPCQP